MRKCLHSQNTFGNGHKSLSSLNQFVFVFFWSGNVRSLNMFSKCICLCICMPDQATERQGHLLSCLWTAKNRREGQKDPHTGKVQFETLPLSLTLSAVGKVKPNIQYARMKMKQISGRILFPNTLQR